MAKVTLRILLATLLVFGGACSAFANVITITDSISSLSEVDHWSFDLNADADLAINVLAFERSASGPIDFFDNGPDNDLLNSAIYLFLADGTYIDYSNRIISAAAWSDGSRSRFDPYLSFDNLFAGSYMLAIGNSALSEADAWSGINSATDVLYSEGLYQIALTSETGTIGMSSDLGPASQMAPVPEPSTIFLLGGGLASLTWYGRKRKKV